MKKKVWQWINFALLAMPIVLTVVHNIILLSLHDLTYYYTLEGMRLNWFMYLIESPIYALSLWKWYKVVTNMRKSIESN